MIAESTARSLFEVTEPVAVVAYDALEPEELDELMRGLEPLAAVLATAGSL